MSSSRLVVKIQEESNEVPSDRQNLYNKKKNSRTCTSQGCVASRAHMSYILYALTSLIWPTVQCFF